MYHEFKTHVSGIPCICRVLHYAPELPMIITGTGFGDCEPPEYEEFEFEILDRKGYKAKWLEDKMDVDDEIRLKEEFLRDEE